jgi:predicted dehydrogenase
MARQAVRAGVIGCGAIAQALHLPGYAGCSGVSLVAASDPDPARRREVERVFPDICTYADHRRMLKAEDLGVVSVASPNRYHAAHACEALVAGADVFLEKPPALSMAEVDEIRRAERRTGRHVIVGFTQRFIRGNRRAKKALNQGAIGEPYMIRVRFAHSGPIPGWAKSDWFHNPKLAGGGALWDMGIHAIDLVLWLMGPIRAVQATCQTLRKEIRVEDNAVVLAEFAGRRALGYLEVGWTSPSGFYGWEICGDEGSLTFDYQGKLTIQQGRRDPSGKVRGIRERVLDDKPTTGGWPWEIRDVMRALAAEDDMGMGMKAGARAVAVGVAAYKSARTGNRVAVRSV